MTTMESIIEDIETLCLGFLGADHSDVDQALNVAADRLLMECEAADHAVIESIIDGIRWGFNAAATVELGGGTMIRLRAPKGVSITYEWLDSPNETQKALIRQTVERAFEGAAA